MNFNICIIQPANYIHSAAFSELAELIGYALQELGHAVAVNINQTYHDATNILIGVHLLDPFLIAQTPKSSIVLNTEQIAQDNNNWNKNILHWAECFTLWDYNERNIAKWSSLGISSKLLKIGFHPNLVRIPKASDQDIDVLFYGSIGPRRRKVLDEIKALGLNVQAVFGTYGSERDKLISRSKVVLNLHHYDSKIFEIVRVFYLMTNSKAVVAEVGNETAIDPAYTSGIHKSSYEDLANACQRLARDKPSRIALEDRAWTTISKLPQKELIASLL